MRFHTFWYISFLSSEFLNHVQKTPKSWEKICSITIFHQNPEKNTFTGLKTPQNCLFSSHLFFWQSWTKVLGHFCISGAFSNSHRSNPSPHPTNNVGRVYPDFFSEFQLCIGWGRENCKKISKTLHCFKREPRNNRKILQYRPKDFCPGLKQWNPGRCGKGKAVRPDHLSSQEDKNLLP